MLELALSKSRLEGARTKSTAHAGLGLIALALSVGACQRPDASAREDEPPQSSLRMSNKRRMGHPRSMRANPPPAPQAGDSGSAAPSGSSSGTVPTETLASPRDRALGIYVVSGRLDGKDKVLDEAVYAVDSVDGVYARLLWSSVEPRQGQFDWAALDAELNRAIAHSKSISISVAAGDATPDWLFKAGAKKLEFQVSNPNAKGAAKPQKIAIAAPWDTVFLSEWKTLVDGLATHLKSVPGGYEHLRIVKITGIGELSSEVRLPASSGGIGQGYALHDDVKMWVHEGYKPSKVLDAFKTIADDFATAFPDKALALEVLESGGFPMIDESGAALPEGPGPDGVTAQMIDFGKAAYPTRFMVQSNGLRQTSAEGMVSEAAKHGAYIGWQTNDWLGAKSQHGVGCGGDDIESARECTEDEFAAVLARGIALGGHYIEVFPYDALHFSKAMTDARAKLVAPRRP